MPSPCVARREVLGIDGGRTVNPGFGFGPDLSALAAAGYGGCTTLDGQVAAVVGTCAPALAMVAWGLVVPPNASFDVPDWVGPAVALAVILAAVLARVSMGDIIRDTVRGPAYVVNGSLL